jgi:hypothetical protein
VLLTLVSRVSSAANAVEQTPVLTNKQVKVLIRTANTPGQHLQIANYFRSEASKLRHEAKEHEAMAAEYDKNPSTRVGVKGRTLGQHCRAFAEVLDDGARKADEQAALHEDMAKAASK